MSAQAAELHLHAANRSHRSRDIIARPEVYDVMARVTFFFSPSSQRLGRHMSGYCPMSTQRLRKRRPAFVSCLTAEQPAARERRSHQVEINRGERWRGRRHGARDVETTTSSQRLVIRLFGVFLGIHHSGNSCIFLATSANLDHLDLSARILAQTSQVSPANYLSPHMEPKYFLE